MPTIFQLPKTVPLSTSGTLLAGAKAYFYETGTNNPKDVYHDFALGTPWVQPVVADGNGVFPVIYQANDAQYRVTLTKADDSLIYTQDNVGGPIATQEELGSILYPQTDAEQSAGVTPTNYAYSPGDVRRYGAVGDGSTDCTTAINNALMACGGMEVYIPGGTWMVLADGNRDGGYWIAPPNAQGGSGGISMPSNSRLRLDPGAVLKAKANSTGYYNVIRIEKVSNVTISDGVIDGNKAQCSAGGGTQQGYGIAVYGSSSVRITGSISQNCWGDGIFVQEASDGTVPTDIKVNGVTCTTNRRNGMSIIGVNGMTVTGSTFSSNSGSAPQNGVDIEPGGFGHTVKNLVFAPDNLYLSNTGRGIFAQTTTGGDIDGVFIGGRSIGNSSDGAGGYLVTGMVTFENVTAKGNGTNGIFVDTCTDAIVQGCTSWGNSVTTDNTSDGIVLQNCTRGVLARNTVRKGGGANLHRYGIALISCINTSAYDNDANIGGHVDYNNFTPTNSTIKRTNMTGNLSVPDAQGVATYSASITPNISTGTVQTITVTNGSGFTINNPTNLPSFERFTLHIKNTSGGAVGTISWGSNYKLAGVWVSPATGYGRRITFYFDANAGLYYEEARSPADIAN